jgi:hypothetical protein
MAMDYKGLDVIDRIPSYSNKKMLQYSEQLHKVMTKKVPVKVGRGKSARIEYELKYKHNGHIIEKMENSIKYYKHLYENEMSNTIELRQYQKDIVEKACEIIRVNKFVYLAMEVRTGKTLTSLSICDNLENVSNVLFLTKKKAIKSITDDSEKIGGDYNLHVINYESIHKLPDVKWDVVVLDEAHGMGAFPKPSGRASAVKSLIAKNGSRVILLSGTPTPESYSQMFHQVYGIPTNPFRAYSNFYKFAKDYVDVKQRKINGLMINDYSAGYQTIIDKMIPYTIRFSQSDAGFVVKTTEKIIEVPVDPKVKSMISILKKNLVVQGKEEVILGDTSVKLMSKLHQMYSGTVKFESGNSMVLAATKAEYIADNFSDKRVGIFYKFKEELEAIKSVLGDNVATTLEDFDNDKCQHIALQIVSGREGISLRRADCLVFYNIDFSATSYWQARDRMTTKDREENHIYWLFSEGGIEHLVYKAVSKKKDYTVSHFKRDILNQE